MSRAQTFDEALQEASATPGLLHCPECLHSHQLSEESYKRPVHCLPCTVTGKVVVMGEVERFDEPEWYDRYLPKTGEG